MTESTTKKRAYVETYGCQMNISDGELMEGVLAARGYEIVSRPEGADVVLVNTCAIREHAERRVLGRVAQLKGLKDDNPDLVLGVTGCMAQRMGDTLLEQAPYVDLVMGPDGYRGLPERLVELRGGEGSGEWSDAPAPRILDDVRSKRRTQLSVLALDLDENYEGLEQRRTSRVAAWVPIQRGCDHRCTFCIVPYVRGPEKNRTPTEVLDEVTRIGDSGVTEITLLGQTVNSWESGEWSFPRLLREVARVPGIRRVRFQSPHPNDVTPELVEVMATEAAVCENLHLPLQAGNDRTLKRMLRRYTVASFLEKVEMVRSGVPGISLSTDVIVAFPGETDAEFEDTLAVMREVRFDDAFTYKYSPRDGTPATRLPSEQFIDPDRAQERLARLIEVHREIQEGINRGEVGRIEEVLVEKEARDPGSILGRTRRNKVVAFPGDPRRIGGYATVALRSTTGATFAGVEVGAPVADALVGAEAP